MCTLRISQMFEKSVDVVSKPFQTTDLHVIEDSRETVGGKLSEVIYIKRERECEREMER